MSINPAVQACRSPEIVEADDPQKALYRSLDFYPTPPWAARAGAQMVKKLDPKADWVWEPACGQGHMAEPLKEYFLRVRVSDIHDFGYGEVLDFLLDHGRSDIDWIVTNPPFKLAEEFTRHALSRARRGVAILARLSWLESVDCYPLFYDGPSPLTVLSPFSERVPMALGRWSPSIDTATAYAWFFFRKDAPKGRTWPFIQPIPPGTRARLAKPEDVRRFCAPATAPLFDEADV